MALFGGFIEGGVILTQFARERRGRKEESLMVTQSEVDFQHERFLYCQPTVLN